MTLSSQASRTGVWLIGARGAVATTTIVGVRAAARGLVPLRGVTTAGTRGQGLPFPAPEAMTFGGWETRAGSLLESARALGEGGRIFDPRLVETLASDLAMVDREIVTGGTRGIPPFGEREIEEGRHEESAPEVIARLRADLSAFRRRHALDKLVVVNVASTEPAFTIGEEHLTLRALEETIASQRGVALRASILYAYAAASEGAAFVNFAASPAALVPAIRELAERSGAPYMGTDGKTGETLVKSALAPLFRERDLRVLSWHGSNVLGNSDGETLDDPAVRAAKVESKDATVRSILGYTPATSVDIRYLPSLGDWKTAWDLIHFEGFLGTRMTMQFTWQGSDSILAAPLIIDLVRLCALALARGERGPMTHAACFFKAPVGSNEQELSRQYAMLDQYLRRARVVAVSPRKAAS